MKRIVTVKFKDGNIITVEPKVDYYGTFDLGYGLTLNNKYGILYKEKGNVICGEDITDKVDTIEIYMKY